MNEVINSAVKFAEVRGVQMAYRITGEGTPLILFNRFRGTINDWDPAFIFALSKRHKVITFDNFGVGATKGHSMDSIEAMAEIAFDFINQLGYKKVDILGWSMGGLIAQVFLLNYPKLVGQAVLVATGPGASEQTEYPTAQFLEIATKVYNMKPEHHQTIFYTSDNEGYKRTVESLSRIEKYSTEVPLTQPATWSAQGIATKSFFNSEADYYNRINQISHPVLIAGAKEDIAFSDQNSYLLYQQIPNSQLVLYSNAAHAFHHQFPVEFGETVLRFLQY